MIIYFTNKYSLRSTLTELDVCRPLGLKSSETCEVKRGDAGTNTERSNRVLCVYSANVLIIYFATECKFHSIWRQGRVQCKQRGAGALLRMVGVVHTTVAAIYQEHRLKCGTAVDNMAARRSAAVGPPKLPAQGRGPSARGGFALRWAGSANRALAASCCNVLVQLLWRGKILGEIPRPHNGEWRASFLPHLSLPKNFSHLWPSYCCRSWSSY